MTTPLLTVEGLTKSFFGVRVLHEVGFALEPGEVMGLVGENGSGKSTTMNILGGVHQPDSGRMTLDGQPYAPRDPKDAEAAGIVGNLDQESGVNPNSVQSGGPGRGIAQWSVGGRWDSSPNDNVKSYAAQKGKSIHALDLQLEFIWFELTQHGYGFSELKATTNVTDATIVFMAKYEICGACASSQRVAYAK